MSFELFFIYDSHCPWSYRATSLINQLKLAYPELNLHLLHTGYFDGNQTISEKQISSVSEHCQYTFTSAYLSKLSVEKNSTLVANLMAWVEQKIPEHNLTLLNALQKAHFEEGLTLDNAEQINVITEQLKLYPPAKALTANKLTKAAEAILFDVEEMQALIATEAIPAMLVGIGNNLILLNHNLYLSAPEKIVEAVQLELDKN